MDSDVGARHFRQLGRMAMRRYCQLGGVGVALLPDRLREANTALMLRLEQIEAQLTKVSPRPR